MAPLTAYHMSATTIEYLVHHVVLPPKLPQSNDHDVTTHEKSLLEVTLQALEELKIHVKDCQNDHVSFAIATIENLVQSRDCHGDISEDYLRKMLDSLISGRNQGAIPLEVRAQNAGILISRSDDHIVFEFFELSPTNEASMRQGRLIRAFPGLASKVPISKMQEKGMIDMVSATVATMSTQAALDMQPTVLKASRMHAEMRDTTHPGMVTDFLMHVIAAVGSTTDTVRISKHTREEVLWSDCEHPWRRSPLWLLVRVSLQLIFSRKESSAQVPGRMFKAFMLFMLSRILSLVEGNWKELGSNHLHFASAKLLRRLRKFESIGPSDCLTSAWIGTISNRLTSAHTTMNGNWRAIMHSTTADINTATLESLRPEDSLDMQLQGLDTFLSSVASRRPSSALSEFKPTGQYTEFPAHTLPEEPGSSSGEYRYFRLAAMEAWVAQHLQSWVQANRHNQTTCGNLRRLMQAYYTTATEAYKDVPISLSTMYLVLLELWVACDLSACSLYPLVKDYDPEICIDTFQCLSLPLKSQMQRLNIAEQYVDSRRKSASHRSVSVYDNFGHASSFAVRYFDKCIQLQDLLVQIERDAGENRQNKCYELARLKRDYLYLMDQYHSGECEFDTVIYNRYHGYTKTVHRTYCSRCALIRQADELSIQIYEWPVSSDRCTAKATIFELRIPSAFSEWRDASFFFVNDILESNTPGSGSTDKYYTLISHPDLSSMLDQGYLSRRIIPLSTVKPHSVTHRRKKMAVLNLENEDVCLENALQYGYYDSVKKEWSSRPNSTDKVLRKCMYRMPAQSLTLEDYLYKSPSHPDGVSPNTVIANLSECPVHYSIDEYKAFGALPFGQNIFYSNILTQLAIPNVDFAKVETHCLVLQTIFQAGPLNGSVERLSHHVLTEPSFGNAVFEQLEVALQRVKGNWESWRAVAAFVQLALRTINLTLSEDIRERGLRYLDTARQASIEWLHCLKDRVSSSTEDEQRTELSWRTTEIALLGASTFDVEGDCINALLQQQDAISSLLECSVLVQENSGAVSHSAHLHSVMIQSWRSMMHRIFPQLRQAVLSNNPALDKAVLRCWSSYRPSPQVRWSSMNSSTQHWLHIASGQLPVHINLLTAELLVNGLPMARLPSEYRSHASYQTLFSTSTLDVAPTDEPGMSFSTKSIYHGYKLHFGMTEQDMLVVAMEGNSKLDLLPSRLFKDQLPLAFITDFIHWYDHVSGEVVFRPRKHPWRACNTSSWHLKRTGSSWRLLQGSNTLLDTNSRYAHEISKILQPLEDSHHIHVLLDATSHTVEIRLPRSKLEFYVSSGDLEIRSRQYRGMAVDTNQCIGALAGLTSKLVLRHTDQGGDRQVLIPEGPISYAKATHHHHVSVAIGKLAEIKVHAYSVDETLGRLLDTGDLQSKIFLCYLHALTSHCLPDILTGYTGTEAALVILKSAAIRSFDVLSEQNIELFKLIAGLSPSRAFYPPHERVMQQIKWDSCLSSLSQHDSFKDLVYEVLHQAKKMLLFHPSNKCNTSALDCAMKNSTDPYLQKRGMARSSVFQTLGFGTEYYGTDVDAKYDTRDTQINSSRGQNAYVVARMILRDEAALNTSVPNLKEALLRTHFAGNVIEGPNALIIPSSLRYDSKWLKNPSEGLRELWCSLHQSLSGSPHNYNKFDIMAWLSTNAYANSGDMMAIQALVAFYRMEDLATVKVPSHLNFTLPHGNTWNNEEIQRIVLSAARSSMDSSEARLPKQDSETEQQHMNRIEGLFRKQQTIAKQDFIAELKKQWPCQQPSTPTSTNIDTYLSTSQAMSTVNQKFENWYKNKCFLEYLHKVSDLIARQTVSTVSTPRCHLAKPIENPSFKSHDRFFDMDRVFAKVPPSIFKQTPSADVTQASPITHEPKLQELQPLLDPTNIAMRDRLDQLCRDLGTYAKSKCERDYVENLRTSCTSLEKQGVDTQVHSCPEDKERFQLYLLGCKTYFANLNSALDHILANEIRPTDCVAAKIKQAPRSCPTFWLGYLNHQRYDLLSEAWKAVFIEYGLAITHLHRAQRLVGLFDKPADFAEEIRQIGHTNWKPADYPETLLLEAESGIMVRAVQATIAEQMRQPPDDSNTVMQLHMGEGKSAVIVPIVAAALADTKRLVRVIVAKPQREQMAEMLISKLGRLLGRRIYHMPFSRDLRLTPVDATNIREMYEECMANRGILLVQPEHILSFKLMGIECLLTEQSETARILLGTEKWFCQMSRDIVDESDENFSVKFELIYTMGSQRLIEFAPERWLIIQEMLSLIPRFAAQVASHSPSSIEVQYGKNGRFPRIRILQSEGADQLLTLLADQIVDFGLIGLPIQNQPELRAAILTYITQAELSTEDIAAVEGSTFWTDATKQPLLLVRGLIACGVLRFTLTQKRWRVNYGLDSSRTPSTKLAVPYKAKDSPSPRSEFSHPDVVIILTLLSFYYGGLGDDELFDSFVHLLKSDQAAIQYDEWIRTAAPELPKIFNHLSGVSIKDRVLCVQEIFPHLRYSRAAINYYLAFLVLPKAMKEFPSKLSASGWDLGAVKTHPITGFSGTNDTMHVLPLTVNHLDLPSQKHTNALVLGYLLQDETAVALLPNHTEGTDAGHLLTAINTMEPEVRVVLDVGALILEMNNEQVARSWLSMRKNSDIQAVVFFSGEQLSIIDTTGRIEPFQTSPFAKQLDRCLVYLDEAHTRGTDLKLPRNYRAAVTLGANLTKDRLVQACMRLRKLGKGQSCVFVAPQEISTKIRERTGKSTSDPIQTMDVLCWSIGETWLDLSRSMPLWAVQGHRFETHKHLTHRKDFLEDEARSLEDRYKPKTKEDFKEAQLAGWDLNNPNISKIVSRCRDFEAMGFNSASLQEEQERELSPEIEEERQIERPAKMNPNKHDLHSDLKDLVRTGKLPDKTTAFEPAFRALRSTSAARLCDLSQFPSDLMATMDFIRTVQVPSGSNAATFISDSYQRPVQWVMSVRGTSDTVQTLVILSPFEANQLRPKFQTSDKVTLHLFSPCCNASYAAIDKLELFSVGRAFSAKQLPRSLTMQLNLFSGSLYLRSYTEYIELCNFLGLLRDKVKSGQQVFADGFITPPSGTWGLKQSPVPFLRTLLMKIRKEGEGIEKTIMGRILNGARLEEIDFEGKE